MVRGIAIMKCAAGDERLDVMNASEEKLDITWPTLQSVLFVGKLTSS